jgi:hypothetical protein
MSQRRILLVGATGVFGSRLARHLTRIDGVSLVVTSRSEARARALSGELRAGGATANIEAAAFDTGHNLAAQLAGARPWLVIDASGPFQGAGYRFPAAALAAGAHWIDLGDACDYLLGFGGALDAAAKSAGCVALAGASSSPALSMAAVDALTSGWRRRDRAEMAIVPAGRSEVGRSVIEGLLTYCGRDVPLRRERRMDRGTGWGWPRRIEVPGLGRRRVSLVETADAELLAARYPELAEVAFCAGLESAIEHWGLVAIGAARARGWIDAAQGLVSPLMAARRLTRLPTSNAGGMLVTIAGLDGEGRPARARWWLVARRGDGLDVPGLPALAAVRALLSGRLGPGARTAAGALDLSAIEREMQPLAIETGRDVERIDGRGLVESIVGRNAYDAMPPALRTFHDADAPVVWSGRADIDAGTGFVARLAGRLVGLPPAGRDVPVTVSVARTRDTETWTRNFGGRRFLSRMSRPRDGIARERFGPAWFDMPLAAEPHGLGFPVSRWGAGLLPLPKMLAPRSISREWQDAQGRFRFDVALSLPLFGPLVHYRGWLAPDG